MKHPVTRAERRAVRVAFITRRRRYIESWYSYQRDPWPHVWGRYAKWNMAHGCRMCKFEKYNRKDVRQRRQALKDSCQSVSWQQEY